MSLEEKVGLLIKIPKIREIIIDYVRTQEDSVKIPYFTMLLEANPADYKIAYDLADSLCKQGEYDHASKVSAQYLNPDDQKLIGNKICFGKAKALWQKDDYDAALGELENMSDENRNSAATRLVKEYMPGAKVTINEFRQFLDKFSLAQIPHQAWKSAVDQALKTDLENCVKDNVPESFSQFLDKLGSIKNCYTDIYKTLLFNAASKRAELLAKDNKQFEAMESLKILEPEKALYEKGLQDLLKVVNEHYQLTICNLLLERQPNNSGLWYSRAKLLEKMQQTDEAFTNYNKSLALGNKDALMDEARLVETKGDYKEANRLYENIITYKSVSPGLIAEAETRRKNLLEKLPKPEVPKVPEKKVEKKGRFNCLRKKKKKR
jgi:tetratricopeptide (TPR) repeat protein